MQVVRLCKRKYSDLDGVGAAKTGGRWNSRAKPLVYTASSPALAVLEYMVHLAELPKGMVLLSIEVPDTLPIEEFNGYPSDVKLSRQIGDEWLDAASTAVLRVPSALVPDSYNYLLNPLHSRAAEISIGRQSPFAFDIRLLSSLPNA